MIPLIVTANGERLYPGNKALGLSALYPLRDWTYIRQRSEVADLFSCSLDNPRLDDDSRYVPEGRDEILIFKSEYDYSNDIRWFGGVITNSKDRVAYNADGFSVFYDLEIQAFNVLLEKELRQPQIANLTWAELIEYLLDRHFSGVIDSDYTNIVNPIDAPPVKIVNSTLLNLLKVMRQITGYDYMVDPYKKLHVFQASDRPVSFVVNDSIAAGMAVYSDYPVVNRASRNIYNIVRQPFQELIDKSAWDGEAFIATGDPKSGQIPLLRRPESFENAIFLEDKFDSGIDSARWIESDTNTTEHPDYPSQGFMFAAEGQLQIIGGTGALGGVVLESQNYFEARENAYIVQEFQLTNTSGTGYIAVFSSGSGHTSGDLKAGFKIVDNELQALDGTTLVAALGTSTNYIFWVTQTADGWQYAIQGGDFPARQVIREETGVTHLSDYKIMPVASVDIEGSINSVRYRENDRGIELVIADEVKTIAPESDADLPDIDAFLNVDESPAVIKFKAAASIAVIASVSSATVFDVATGQGASFTTGQRILIGESLTDAFAGRDAYVESISGDEITLMTPGVSGLSPGDPILVGTTLPAVNDPIRVKYSFFRENEAAASDQASIDKYGPIPLTLDIKDHIKTFEAAETEASAYLERFRDGILEVSFLSNSWLIAEEPETLKSVMIQLSKRPDPISRNLTISRVTISPMGAGGFSYAIDAESADPVKPLEDLITDRALVIGQDGTLRFSAATADKAVIDGRDLVIHPVDSPYITFGNPEGRKFGEAVFKP